MASLCREFAVPRSWRAMNNAGPGGFAGPHRRLFCYADQLPAQVEAAIVAARVEKPNWGARRRDIAIGVLQGRLTVFTTFRTTGCGKVLCSGISSGTLSPSFLA